MNEKMKKHLDALKAQVLDLLFPEEVACLCCKRAPEEGSRDGLCEACREKLSLLAQKQEEIEGRDHRRPPEGIESIHAAFPYEGEARALVLLLKRGSIRKAAVPLAGAMATLPGGEADVLVPVPTDEGRKRERGFNQSEVLADLIGKSTGMPVQRALYRIDHRKSQMGLRMKERMTNVEGCMRAEDTAAGKRVILVDDVVTTGSTVREAARALRDAGAVSVGVFAACRTLQDEDDSEDELIWKMLST